MTTEQIKWLIETFLGVEVPEGAAEVELAGKCEGLTLVLPPVGEDWCYTTRKETGHSVHWKLVESAVRSLTEERKYQSLSNCRIDVISTLDDNLDPVAWINVSCLLKLAGSNVMKRSYWETYRYDELSRHMVAEFIEGRLPGAILLDWLINQSEDGELEALLAAEAETHEVA